MDNKITQNDFLARMKKAKDNVNKFSNLPCGTYFCLLAQVKYAPSKSGKEMVQFIYKVLEGDYRNREHRNFYMIGSSSEVPFNMMVQDIASLGYPVDEVTSMEAMLALYEQIGQDALHVTIRISENPDPQYAQYLRTRIEEVVDVSEVVEDEAPAPAVNATPTPTPEPEPIPVVTSAKKPAIVVEADVVEDAEPAPQTADVAVEEDVIEEEDEELDIDVGAVIEFEFKGANMKGVIESGSADGLTAVVTCEDGKKRKVKCEKILKVIKAG